VKEGIWAPRSVVKGAPKVRPAQAAVEDAADWVERVLGFCPDAIQAQILRSESRRGILNCSRQWGKSTVTAAKAIHHAKHRPESLVVVVSPSARQSGEFLRKAAGFVSQMGVRPRSDGHNEMSLALPNRSRIVGLPGNEATVRGFSAVSLMLVDEASRVDDGLYHALRPMLAVSNGSLWLMSTPRGKTGFFYEEWERGGPQWERVKATAAACPRIRPEFLEEERQSMGERVFRQEYLCEFDDVASSLFEDAMIRRAITDDFEAWRL
jgi:hypothetical protein